ncbi:MAG: hypothetical protein WBG95_03345 [Sulfitobacter sp.]
MIAQQSMRGAAKNDFQVHGINDHGEIAFNLALRWAQVLSFVEPLKACLIGVEACGTSHYWARDVIKLADNIKLTPEP